MPCTKTGCHVYIDTHGEFAWGDAFEVGNVAYFRLVRRSRKRINDLPYVHYTVWGMDAWFNKGELDERLNDSFLVSNNFTKHIGEEVS